MRITKVEVKNFKGFPGSYEITLHNAGKNLLAYGENGSGKSSLVRAIQLFLESGARGIPFSAHQNIFETDPGYVKLEVQPTTPAGPPRVYEWSEANATHRVAPIIEAAKKHGFVDYKGLLRTYLLEPQATTVNVFDLLVESILANSINPITDNPFAEDWQAVQQSIPQRHTQRQVDELQYAIDVFNQGLAARLPELKTQATEILQMFEHNVVIDFQFTGVTYQRDTKTIENRLITLVVEFCDETLVDPWHFLNEARLSAIILSIYFASLLLVPDPDLKILALDDVLIGLDMSNRLPVLQILQDYFSDYQIILTTYDKFWYSIIQNQTAEAEWKYIEMYANRAVQDRPEVPVIKGGSDFIAVARTHFNNSDYKAAAVYIRSEFERLVRQYCHKKRVPVVYKKQPQKHTSDDFWQAIKSRDQAAIDAQDANIITEIERWRRLIMNPLSHHDVQRQAFRIEIDQTIDAVERLRDVFQDIW